MKAKIQDGSSGKDLAIVKAISWRRALTSVSGASADSAATEHGFNQRS